MLIPGFEKIQKREMLDCRMKALQELIRYYGADISSLYIFLLSESFSFSYGRMGFPEISLKNIPYAVASVNEVEKKVFDNLGIDYTEESVDSTADGWKQLREMVDKNTPVLTKIDGRFAHDSQSTAPHGGIIHIHYLSSLLLVGYSEDGKTVKVILTNTDEKDTPTELSMETFQTYRNSNCIPYSPNGTCFRISGRYSLSSADIEKRILGALYRTAQTALEGRIFRIEAENFGCDTMETGVEAIQHMHGDLKRMYGIPWKNQRADTWKKTLIFTMLFLRNNLLYGTYSLFRSEFARALEKYSREYGDVDMEMISKRFRMSAKLWKEWLTLAARIPHNPRKFKRYFRTANRILLRIYRKEKTAMTWLLRHTGERLGLN